MQHCQWCNFESKHLSSVERHMRNVHDGLICIYPSKYTLKKRSRWYLNYWWKQMTVERLEEILEGVYESIKVKAYFRQEGDKNFDLHGEEMQAVLEILDNSKTEFSFYKNYDEEELEEFAEFLEYFKKIQNIRLERKKTLRK